MIPAPRSLLCIVAFVASTTAVAEEVAEAPLVGGAATASAADEVAPGGQAREGLTVGASPTAAYLEQDAARDAAVITDKLGSKVPVDVAMTRHDGVAVKLGDYLRPGAEGKPGKPVVLVLGYYECPMLCSLVMNGAMESLAAVDLTPGDDYELVVISIDAKETPALAAAKRESYLKRHVELKERTGTGFERGASFHVAEEAAVRRVADAVGFGYVWHEKSQQWAHGAGIFLLAPDGTLTRTLMGVSFEPTQLRYSIIDASRGEVGTLVDRIVMSCFRYEADAHKYAFYIWGAVRLFGALTVFCVGTLLFVLWRRERHRKGPAVV